MPTYTVKITGDLTGAETYVAEGVDPSLASARSVLLQAQGPLGLTQIDDFTYESEVEINAGKLPSALVCELRGLYDAGWAIEVKKAGTAKALYDISGSIGDTTGSNFETRIFKLT